MDFDKVGYNFSAPLRGLKNLTHPTLAQLDSYLLGRSTNNTWNLKNWNNLSINRRHTLTQISKAKANGNTVLTATPEEIAQDIAEIRTRGDLIRTGQDFTVSSGRVYRIHDGGVHPVDGPKTINLTSAEYNILAQAKKNSSNAYKSLEIQYEKGLLKSNEYQRTKAILDLMKERGVGK